MAFQKLPRLAVNWPSQPEMLRRYWDQAMSALESLYVPGPVSSLPPNPGVLRRLVNDSTSTTFNDIVAGGGSFTVPVFYDGTNWRIG